MNPNSYTHIINPIRTCAHIHSQLTGTVTFFFLNNFFGIEASPDLQDYISHPWNGTISGNFFLKYIFYRKTKNILGTLIKESEHKWSKCLCSLYFLIICEIEIRLNHHNTRVTYNPGMASFSPRFKKSIHVHTCY